MKFAITKLNKETARCIGNKLSTIGRKAVFRDTQLDKTPVHMGICSVMAVAFYFLHNLGSIDVSFRM